ncbi:hypothetical protein G5V58_20685 [Nocardioides anomalus]|uniref:Uncharacterized protein n=1 Tax=Nocardioides anomalus TaxID=2712223 RepID=A0A6G6WIF7_9ACTN|nr:hypothetical protein [Nocardioides anomalus]QIG44875.1 hypothetical protein G5V58_20685 [Nocardioides anomalus]
MPDVILGRAGSTVVVDVDVCVKTGVATKHRVVLRGQTTPTWVSVLLLFTVVGYLFAQAMTSRRYHVTLPFAHAVHDRWRRNRRLCWAAGLAGTGAVVMAATVGHGYAGLWAGAGLTLIAGGVVLGAANALVNNVGVRMTRADELVLTRAHPFFVRAVRRASVEPLSR